MIETHGGLWRSRAGTPKLSSAHPGRRLRRHGRNGNNIHQGDVRRGCVRNGKFSSDTHRSCNELKPRFFGEVAVVTSLIKPNARCWVAG